MAGMAPYLNEPPAVDEVSSFDLLLKHGHQDLVQAVAFNSYGDRCATGSVDGKIRVFNRHKDGIWRHCDNWSAHGGEILELQWLPPTIYPNLLASLGIEGRFKLWAEDPSAAPGRRFSNATRGSSQSNSRNTGPGVNPNSSFGSVGGDPTTSNLSSGGNKPQAAFETRNARSPYRSFSMKHVDDTRHTYLALVSADGGLTVYENETPEDLADYSLLDELSVIPPPGVSSGAGAGRSPSRGEETAFRVRFDPNAEVCYSALRAGVPGDALAVVVAAMDCVRIYRTRDVVQQAMGVATAGREFYLAAEIGAGVHRGLVRDVAWAPGNIRGFDIIATACQDGFVRVFRVETPLGGNQESEGRGWSWRRGGASTVAPVDEEVGSSSRRASTSAGASAEPTQALPKSGIRAGFDQLRTSSERRSGGNTAQSQVRHIVTEMARLDSHRTPVWRVGFDDDGQILGSVGDEGKLMCYRQTPGGSWAKSAELGMMKMRMAAA
ncbi:WD40-repeat-containing domain protein [Lasiosphaeris hirsuta]|uniref:WD40-repeat-containing domain protein n=1 Tax=Lasiosphaeris hirsuta TaxID=260670 RepID=A0AA40AGZ9_9PEZI|nr:WD40-repeat-containing domain protein [Lasiosphaeris hirsuta]